MKTFDIVIIGGGPAGAGAAKKLKDSGLSYCVIEKYIYPRKKLCAGGLTNKSTKAIKQLGLDTGCVQKRGFDAVTFATKNCKKEVSLNDPLFMVDRIEFDAEMMKQSVSDEHLFQGETVTDLRLDENLLITDKDEYKFRYIIFADGVNGYSGRLISGREFGFAVECNSPVIFDKTVVDFEATKDGYGWIFPKVEHTTIGLGGNGKHSKDYVEQLMRFANKYDLEIKKADIKGFRLPVFSEEVYKKSVIDEKAILVGDAGGMVDCITGEGICYALLSGMYAAEAIISAEEKGTKLSDVYFKKTAGIARVLQRRIDQSRILYSPLRNFMIRKALTDERYIQRLRNAFG